MGNYYHIRYTFVFEHLPIDIVEMIDIQDKWHSHNNYYKQTDEDIVRRRKECYALSDKFAEEAEDQVKEFIHKHAMDWDGFLLYETNIFEWVCDGIAYPWGIEFGDLNVLHGQMDLKNAQTFRDFVELVRPYIKSGSAWGWWESDMSAFEVFY